MKKILSLIVFTAALVWSWNVIHSSSAVGFETHSAIQQKFSELIQDTIKNKKPEASNVEIVKLWTENLGDRKIKAIFSYKFTMPTTADNSDAFETIIDGEAVLYRDLSEDPTVDKWTLQSLTTTGDSVNYIDGSLITPDNATDEKTPDTN